MTIFYNLIFPRHSTFFPVLQKAFFVKKKFIIFFKKNVSWHVPPCHEFMTRCHTASLDLTVGLVRRLNKDDNRFATRVSSLHETISHPIPPLGVESQSPHLVLDL
jgi:hypothetical protein